MFFAELVSGLINTSKEILISLKVRVCSQNFYSFDSKDREWALKLIFPFIFSFFSAFVDVLVCGLMCVMVLIAALFVSLGFRVWCDEMTRRFETCSDVMGNPIDKVLNDGISFVYNIRRTQMTRFVNCKLCALCYTVFLWSRKRRLSQDIIVIC